MKINQINKQSQVTIKHLKMSKITVVVPLRVIMMNQLEQQLVTMMSRMEQQLVPMMYRMEQLVTMMSKMEQLPVLSIITIIKLQYQHQAVM
jgi:hypothetical protein